MAKYNDTKFYWLMVKEDFFEDDALEWLEDQPNGSAQVLFYLKLCLKSLKTNGVLYKRVGSMVIPYNTEKLSQITRTPLNTVQMAIQNLMTCGLIRILDNGELYMTQVETMIGSQSVGAFKKQQQRMLREATVEDALEVPPPKKVEIRGGGQGVDNCPPNIEIENRDRDRDRDKKEEIEKEEANASVEPDGPTPEPSEAILYSEIQSLFNETCKSLKPVQRMTDGRRKAIAARWKEYGKKIDVFRQVFTNTEKSDFLTGRAKDWAASFDWLMKPSNFVKVLEGNYENKGEQRNGSTDRSAPQSNDDAYWREQVENMELPEWVE